MRFHDIHSYSPIYLSAAVIVIVNGLALLYCKVFNRNHEAQRYYKNFEPIKFYVMEFCYTIIVLSLSYNMRFLVTRVWQGFHKT